MDGRVVADYLALLVHRLSGGVVPPGALTLATLVVAGALLETGALAVLVQRMAFVTAITASAAFVEVANATVNRFVLGGVGRLRISRFGSAAVAILFNVAVGVLARRLGSTWLASGIAGAVAGAVWTNVAGRR